MVSLLTTLLSRSAKVGDRVFVGVYLDCPQKQTFGADVILDVSPNLQVNAVYPTKLLGGDSFNLTKGNHVVFSSLTSVGGSSFTGGGLLGILDCTALSIGEGTITFDFTLGATTDCNVSSVDGKDLLEGVSNRSIPIT